MMGWLPENVSTYGKDIDRLFYIIYYITGTTFLLVTGALVIFLILYRQREGRRATYVHGNTTLEVIWTIVPAIILVVLSFMSQASWGHIKGRVPPSDIHVQVTAKQFNWEILYPGPDGKIGTADDLQMENELHVPVGKVVRVTLKAKDVIHSFFLPNLRLKQDAVPGREIQAWFEATKPGRYELPCAELCGFGHSGMLGHLTVHTADNYDKWVKEQWPSS
ncbi:MAG: cytochrome c oxidase subunit II [Candidatus Methylomirabilis oxyfera]|nr:cytochrome c oxidase subunit II [Candidatus Methylomirabilis oxyfera]